MRVLSLYKCEWELLVSYKLVEAYDRWGVISEIEVRDYIVPEFIYEAANLWAGGEWVDCDEVDMRRLFGMTFLEFLEKLLKEKEEKNA